MGEKDDFVTVVALIEQDLKKLCDDPFEKKSQGLGYRGTVLGGGTEVLVVGIVDQAEKVPLGRREGITERGSQKALRLLPMLLPIGVIVLL